MSNYCSANSEGELFPFFVLMPFGFCLILVLSFIAYKFHLFKYFDKIVFTKIHPLLIYILGIPVVFLLSITGVYSNPTSISASGSDTLSEPLIRAIYVTFMFSLLWPLLLIGGLVIDGLLLGTFLYYPMKDLYCGNFSFNFILHTDIIQIFSLFFSPFFLFLNSSLYYLILLAIICLIFEKLDKNKVMNKSNI